jgi:histidine triad (HIT) family protein
MTEGTTPANCIFCKIVRGEIPSQKVYEDDAVLAFKDVRPAAPVHVLLVPKQHIASLYDAGLDQAPLLGRMLGLTGRIAREQGATDGFRTIVNTGRMGGQEVYHLHIHVIGGPKPLGPMIVRQ